MSNPKRLIFTLTLALAPALAAAWTPYGNGPYQPATPGQSGPGTFDQGPAPGYGPMGPMEPRGSMGPPPPMVQRGGMRIRQGVTDDAYLLDIQLSGVKPAEVKVDVNGPWILVTQDRSAETSQQETFDDGRGYRRSFSYSSGRASRRFTVPRDGDTSAMQRQDTEDAIRITIPRTLPVTGTR
jgi:HSP20 family molecular chaperone IbpA